MKPFNKITTLNYVKASTMEVVETIRMREFYVWDRDKKNYRLTRHYNLAKESELNPGFGHSPQNDEAFPKGEIGF